VQQTWLSSHPALHCTHGCQHPPSLLHTRRQQDAVLPSVVGVPLERLDAWWSGHREEVTRALSSFALEVVTPGAIVVSSSRQGRSVQRTGSATRPRASLCFVLSHQPTTATSGAGGARWRQVELRAGQ
jgi:hypothetical protein